MDISLLIKFIVIIIAALLAMIIYFLASRSILKNPQ